MAELIVSAFDTAAHADAAEADLARIAGLSHSDISRYRPGDPGAPTIAAAGTTATTTAYAVEPEPSPPRHEGGFFSWLFGTDDTATTPHEDTDYYGQHITAGRTIVRVRAANSAQAEEIIRVIDRHNPEAMEIQSDDSTSTLSGTPTTTGSATPGILGTSATAASSGRATETSPPPLASGAAADTSTNLGTEQEQVIPLSEEQLSVGKRVVSQGRTRVRRYVIEEPAEATVHLRDERASVERRPASGQAAPDAFQDRTVEVATTREEPVVNKEAHVTEEVVVGKTGGERAETVRDTVRREEVDVDKDKNAASDRPLTGRPADVSGSDRPLSDRPTDPRP